MKTLTTIGLTFLMVSAAQATPSDTRLDCRIDGFQDVVRVIVTPAGSDRFRVAQFNEFGGLTVPVAEVSREAIYGQNGAQSEPSSEANVRLSDWYGYTRTLNVQSDGSAKLITQDECQAAITTAICRRVPFALQLNR